MNFKLKNISELDIKYILKIFNNLNRVRDELEKRVSLGTLTLKGGRGQKKNQNFSLLEKGKIT